MLWESWPPVFLAFGLWLAALAPAFWLPNQPPLKPKYAPNSNLGSTSTNTGSASSTFTNGNVVLASIAPNITTSNGTVYFNGTAVLSSGEASGLARGCDTLAPNSELRRIHKIMDGQTPSKRELDVKSKTMIDTYFHLVSNRNKSKDITPKMVNAQVTELNNAFASANFGFNFKGATWTVNDTWANGNADHDMKSTLRKGGYSALNLYYQTNLTSVNWGVTSVLLGLCTLPSNVTYYPCSGCALQTFPSSYYIGDGCNILAGSMPGGSQVSYNLGKTTVHEVGHWLGLLHTFQDNTCAAGDPGDYIDDTPQESISTDGCPIGKQSCTNSTGPDPIHNYMDYSQDSCYESFTPKQIVRMQQLWSTLRKGH